MGNNIRYSNATATTGVPKALVLDDILKAVEKIESRPFPKGVWMLIAPNGRTWANEDPNELLKPLALECYPLKF